MKILILGGTYEARMLADALVALGHEVITSLAGRTSEPRLPAGDVRVGKFGGIPGLAAYLKAFRIDQLVDATHPYAGLISINAVAASQQAGVPLVRLMRSPWDEPDDAPWQHYPDTAAAAKALPANAKVLLTTGHAGLVDFLTRDDCDFIVRLIEPPELALPRHARLLIDRPPYTLDGELGLIKRHDVTHIVTKNSGGNQTSAKLAAARQLGIAVVMIARPQYGPAIEVETVDAAVEAIHRDTPPS
jgi:precorrin-6A/cobalt-precorrin-6A reductase